MEMEQTSERNCANERERSSEGLASNTSSHAALDGIGVPSQPTRTFRFLSDAQMREIGALFHLLDLNKDGFLSAIRAVALCRQLGFNVDRTSVDRGSPNVSLQQLYSWCDKFLEACASSEEIRLTQKFILLQRGEVGKTVSRGSLRRSLESSNVSVSETLISELLAYMSDLDETAQSSEDVMSEAGFKAFIRKHSAAGERKRQAQMSVISSGRAGLRTSMASS
mmetsp:Transcript_1729/g.3625  ORF Transcript_1729/g.3625 Transcript_1729/m.3625 type:complete len:223 (+) Transcript_1729:268-936(+)